LFSTYSVLSNILLSRLTPYGEETLGDLQCIRRSNRSNTYHIFCFRQILEIEWKHNEAVHQLFIDLKKSYDSVRREVLCNIVIAFGIPRRLVRLIEMSSFQAFAVL
jgi:hypothetical protein